MRNDPKPFGVTAGRLWLEAHLCRFDPKIADPYASQIAKELDAYIDRVVRAAQAEERAACLLIIAREQFDRRAQSDDEPKQAQRMALNSMAFVCEVLMEAISKRSEVNTAHKNSEVQ